MLRCLVLISILLLSACDNISPENTWNDPYPNQPANANTLYLAFNEQPKHLDPATSYNASEWQFIGQIYEPVVEYNYLLRPYTLQPLTADSMPSIQYDAKTDTTTYTIRLKPKIMYQPHPAFAQDAQGNYYYHNLTHQEAIGYKDINSFTYTGTRELKAADYVNQIKRIADPKLNSPVFGFLNDYIPGLGELRDKLNKEYAQMPDSNCLDLRNYELSNVQLIDDYSYNIKIKGKYPQFIYWLQMIFFAPVPWEASAFYCQKGLEQHNINLDTYPIGTGAYYLSENNPERRMVLKKNPNFHPDYYPTFGMPGDKEAGLLHSAGERLPFIDEIIFSLEKESIPSWDKFLQGYYDSSAISSDNFNSVISTASTAGFKLSQKLINKGMRLRVSNNLNVFYWGFNMLDPIVGGYNEKSRNLRKAINLAFDVEEYIAIFTNGRALRSYGPIPPGIEGYEDRSHFVYEDKLTKAKQLLSDAGYPNGIDKQTGKPLQIYFDAISVGDPSEKAMLGWVTKQFNKIGLDLVIRVTDPNRLSEKFRAGDAQFFFYGWNADYPDPENFLFLFFGLNGVTQHDGVNMVNYNNSQFDELFLRFKRMEAGDPNRAKLIAEMLDILQIDTPWVWGLFPQSFGLFNAWYKPSKPTNVGLNTLKYIKIDPDLRSKLRAEWNKPILWPLIIGIIVIMILMLPAIIGYVHRANSKAKRFK